MKMFDFMQRFSLILHTLFIFGTISIAQIPELVIDFNPGEKDAFTAVDFSSIEINGKWVFPIYSDAYGMELGVLDNGALSILKNIVEGEFSSNPTQFVLLNDEVFFLVYEERARFKYLWKTDGTNTNATSEYAPNIDGQSKGIIVSQSGDLYYTDNYTLLLYDGVYDKYVLNNVSLEGHYNEQSKNYCQYKNGIAFTKLSMEEITLFTANGDSVQSLGTVNKSPFHAIIYGLSELNTGLLFSAQGTFLLDVNPPTGSYFYDHNADTLYQFTVAGGFAAILQPFNKKHALAWVIGKGYYAVNGLPDQEVLLFESSVTNLNREEGILYTSYKDKIIFLAQNENPEPRSKLLFSDGTLAGTSVLLDLEAPYLSNIKLYEKYAYFATGTASGLKPELYRVQMETGTLEKLYSFDLPSMVSPSIQILGVQNDKLYFAHNLNSAIGRELYSIDLELATRTNDPIKPSFSVIIRPGAYRIVSGLSTNARVQIYSLDGKLIDSYTQMTNVEADLRPYKGLNILRVQLEKEVLSYKFFNP
jgi:hypothetical protein